MARIFNCINQDKVLSSEPDADTTGPYLRTKVMVERTELRMNPDFPDDAKCDCGHAYYRHFDGYENWDPVGCKYCGCWTWHPPVEKAGIIPYRHDGRELRMMFMISSDPKYGGPLPQISKGYVDPTDKSSKHAAIREGEEELGLKLDNTTYQEQSVYNVLKGTIQDEKEYTFALYAVEVKDEFDFNQPHFETGAVVWMTAEQFMNGGREAHKELVKQAFIQIAKVLGYKEKSVDVDLSDFQEVEE
jgi:8-oxo-dGTP pyrophosphatase MutT (NUDIX family)